MPSLLLLALTGCGGNVAAPYGATLDMTNLDGVALAIDTGLLEPNDRIGALVKLQGLVTGPNRASTTTDAVPMNGVQVEITSGWSQAYLIPESAVRVVDDYETECDESGATSDENDPCNAWFNETDETWVEFGGDYTDLENFRPTYFVGETDNRGLIDFYTFIDSVPVDEEGAPIAFSVYGTIGVDDDITTFEFG